MLKVGTTYQVRFGPPEQPERCKWYPAKYEGIKDRRRNGRITTEHVFRLGPGETYSTTNPEADVR